jgi:hypothetical protein
VILTTLDNVTQGEVQRYAIMMFSLNCAVPMRVLLRLSLLIRILIIGNTKLSLRNLVNLLMTALLGLSLL